MHTSVVFRASTISFYIHVMSYWFTQLHFCYANETGSTAELTLARVLTMADAFTSVWQQNCMEF